MNNVNETVIGQIHRDGFVYPGISLFETRAANSKKLDRFAKLELEKYFFLNSNLNKTVRVV